MIALLRRCVWVPVLAILLVSAPASAAEGAALLWRFQRPGVAPSYLFGTIHLSLPDVLDIGPAARAALLEADVVMAESTPAELFKATYRAEEASAAPQERAAGALDPALLRRLLEQAPCYGLTQEEVRAMPVWLLLPRLVLTPPATAKAERERREQGAVALDGALVQMAAAAGKPTVWIESPRRQIDIFKTMPRDDVIAILRQVAKRPACAPGDTRDPMLELYRARDLDGMATAFEASLAHSEDPEAWRRLWRRLLADRHQAMAERIESYAREGSVFVAVGAGHLPGPEGLLATLASRGWTVEPVE